MRIHFYGILQVAVNPIGASDIGYCGKVRRQSAPPAFECVALAAADGEKKFFTVVYS